MNTSKQCRIDINSGQLFSILFQENDGLETDTIDVLAKQFDLVMVSPAKCNDSDSQPASCEGVEVMALRKKSNVDLESSDISAILNTAWPGRSRKKATL